MSSCRGLSLVFLILLLSSCASNNTADAPEPLSEEEIAAELAMQEEARAEFRAVEERFRAEREAAERANDIQRENAERLARVAQESEELALLERERQAEAEEAVRREAASRIIVTRTNSAKPTEPSRVQIEQQQLEISSLEAQIASTDTSIISLESANSVLQETITVAGTLTSALRAEEAKYAYVDTETGMTENELNKNRLADLTEQLQRLRSEASRLTSLAN